MSGSRNRRELSRNNQAPTLQFEFPDLHRLPPRECMPVSNRGTCENQNQRIFTNMISWWNDLQVQWGLVRQFETLDMRNMTWLYILSTKPDIRTIQGKLRLWDSALRALDNTQPMSPCGDLFHSATAPCSWQCFESLSLRNALPATCATAPAFETCCFEIVFIPQVKDTFPAKCATTPSPAEPHQNKAYQTLHRHTNHI